MGGETRFGTEMATQHVGAARTTSAPSTQHSKGKGAKVDTKEPRGGVVRGSVFACQFAPADRSRVPTGPRSNLYLWSGGGFYCRVST